MVSLRPNLNRAGALLLSLFLALSAACGGGGGGGGGTSPANVAPVFSTHPQNLTLTAGAAATFTASASGTPAPSFQWRKNGTPIAGATSTGFSIAATVLTDAGTYDVVASNVAGSATSNSAVLTITPANQAPSTPIIVGPSTGITLHPATYNFSSVDPEGDAITFLVNGAAISGNTYQFNPTAAGTQVISVQARDNKTPPATSATATLSVNVAANHAPQFTSPSSAQITAASPSFTWNTFQVAALDADTDEVVYSLVGTPVITDNTGVGLNGTLTFDPGTRLVEFSGTLPLSRSAAIATFSIKAEDRLPGTNTLLGASSTQVVTLTYNLSLGQSPAITTQPQSLTVTTGQPASFNVIASGTSPLAYQWRKDGLDLGGATGSTFSIGTTATGDAGSYEVIVSNSFGTVTSNAATLTVNPAGSFPAITQQPEGGSVVVGLPFSFQVVATGAQPLSYQWNKDGQKLTAPNSPTLSFTAVALADAGNYSVTVKNSVGSVTSQVVPLQVVPLTGGTNILMNPGFESGRVIWGSNDPTNVIDNTPSPGPRSGTWKAWLGGYPNINTDTLYQTFTIPAAATSATLSFWIRIITSEPGVVPLDNLTIEIRNPFTNVVIATLATYSNLDANVAYQQKLFDLTAYKGQSVRLHFSGTTNVGNATSWLMDDFTLDVISPSGLSPAISGFNPTAGPVGTPVTVTGTGFWGLTNVTFNGTAASFTVQSASQFTTTVPAAAADGPITAMNSAGTGASATHFDVTLPVPTISLVTPGSGPVGTPVVIAGANLTGATSVQFNGTSAAFTVSSSTQISTTVPAGATTGVVTVQTPGGIAAYPAGFTVTAGGPTLDLSIDGLYVTQASQTYARGVPLVKGRNGFLRVFAKANQVNSATPSVRVRIYNGPTLVNTYSIPAPSASVPTSITEGTLSSSWNLSLPATDIQAGYSILADVDPAGAVAEADEANNQYPASGSPLLLGALVVQPFRTTFLPVTQSSLTGNITPGNLAAWTDRAERMYPFETVDSLLGATYTTSTALQADGTGWSALLGEIESKRIADGFGTTRYYFGVVATGYASGVAGLGYVPGSSASTSGRSALGWDKTGYSDGGNFPEVYAHELGHNFGRSHAPCGGPANPDPLYPYTNGDIGMYGYDLATSQLKAPGSFKDIMGYCSPNWISDYTYAAMLAWRQSDAVHLPPPGDENGTTVQESLLVWGRLEKGAWTLEPAFPVAVTPQAPETGDCVAEGFDGSGKRLFSVGFGLLAVGCGPGHEGDGFFNLAIPLEPAALAQVARIVVSRNGLAVAERRPSPMAHLSPARPAAARLMAGSTDLVWDDGAYPMAAVRDPLNGEILAFARGGFITLPGEKRELEVLLSDGVQTVRQRLQVAE